MYKQLQLFSNSFLNNQKLNKDEQSDQLIVSDYLYLPLELTRKLPLFEYFIHSAEANVTTIQLRFRPVVSLQLSFPFLPWESLGSFVLFHGKLRLFLIYLRFVFQTVTSPPVTRIPIMYVLFNIDAPRGRLSLSSGLRQVVNYIHT